MKSYRVSSDKRRVEFVGYVWFWSAVWFYDVWFYEVVFWVCVELESRFSSVGSTGSSVVSSTTTSWSGT